MNFQASDEQQQLADSLARVLQDHGAFEQRRAISKTEAGWNPALWGQLAQLGVTALGIPEAYGGLGRLDGQDEPGELSGGAVDRQLAMQAFGHALLLEPYLASCVLGATAVREAASPAQKEALLPGVAAGEALLAWAHDETAGRHAPLWVETRARRTADGWRLDGVKPLVLHAAAAGHCVVSARLHGQPDEPDGLLLFLVDTRNTGVSLRPYRLIDDTPAGELSLRDAPAQLLGQDADHARAAAAIKTTLAAGSAAACADMVGSMACAFELTTAYVNTRQQFGRLIGEYQAVRHRVADMAVHLEMARSMAFAAAVAADDLAAPGALADMARAKLAIGRAARALCHAAIQTHGGIGMTEEYAVGHCLRRIHVMDQLFGDEAAQARRLKP
ncbi:MAG: acyl-CoA dehydrogenase family protein [Pseudomonadota bacterium]|jgi:alkylation response protein AidB-like acyl-CoA dehydrogenase